MSGDLAAVVLGAMVGLQAPGESLYSRMVTAQDAPRPCADVYSLLCAPPAWSTHRQAWTVAEPPAVGLARYQVIAEAVAALPDEPVRRFVLTSFYHESGFREDVHVGLGAAARGDCTWRDGARVPGSCKSVCLGQLNIGRGRTLPPERYTAAELVGTDEAATARCVTATQRVIEFANARCGGDPWCVFGLYVAAPKPRENKDVARRVRTWAGLPRLEVTL